MSNISEQQWHAELGALSSVGDALQWGEQKLAAAEVFLGHGTDSYHDEVVALLLYAIEQPWNVDPSIVEATLTDGQRDLFGGLLLKRINQRVPVPYLTGKAWFCGLEFSVDERVLIPRSPIAELIEYRFYPWVEADNVSRVLDLCTGGGCIAIACAHAFPGAQIDATDIDEGALEVCRENIAQYELKDRVRARLGDGLAAAEGQYDLIVSNPPYVDAQDMASLPDEFRHEPELALASGEDGLDFTRKVLVQAADYLSEQGVLVLEVGNSMEAVERVWPTVPFMWLEFERGGHGVFIITREQLIEYREIFQQTL